jgi:hypothetical protein
MSRADSPLALDLLRRVRQLEAKLPRSASSGSNVPAPRTREVVDLTFVTEPEVEASFPKFIDLTFEPIGAVLVRVQDSIGISYAGCYVRWKPHDSIANRLVVSFITGLEPSSQYTLTLEVLGA